MRQFEYSALSDVQKWSGLPAGQHLFESFLVFQNYPVAMPPEEGAGSSISNSSVNASFFV